MNIYKSALTNKLRFKTPQGVVTTEDLFSLNLEQLDVVAKSINRELKAEEEESFIQKKTSKASKLQLALDVVKDVIETKISNLEAAEKRAATIELKDKARQILANKQLAAMESLSEEELKAIINS